MDEEQPEGELEPEVECPNYHTNINITAPDKKEITWEDTLDSIRDRAIEKEEDNIKLPIYRYTKLINSAPYNLCTIIHEC